MKQLATLLTEAMKKQNLIVDEQATQQTIHTTLQQSDLLTPAITKEVLFQADKESKRISEEDAKSIAENYVYEGDWSEMNDNILDEIKTFEKLTN